MRCCRALKTVPCHPVQGGESFYAFTPSFTGGVFVAAGVFDGQVNIITGAGAGGPQRDDYSGKATFEAKPINHSRPEVNES
jgi:hypothetical protein